MSEQPSEPNKVELVVIGAGPGGYTAAFRAAELGLAVTVVDPEPDPGGVCLYRGCIPSKALLHVAKIVDEARESAAIGVTFGDARVDIPQVQAWKNELIAKLTGGLGSRMARLKIGQVRGRARFKDPHTLVVEAGDGSMSELRFEQAIVAAGSRPISLPGVPWSDRVIDSTDALELKSLPETLLVVGGGYIGLELGSAYAALGSSVSVVEMTAGLLPGCDRDLVSVLKRRLDQKLAATLLGTKVVTLSEEAEGVEVTMEDRQGTRTSARYSQVLVAVGRRPNSDRLGLEHAQVELDERGFATVDAQRRTAVPHIFAIGDIAGEPMLAHKAYAEAQVAAEAAAGRRAVYDPRAIPAVVFTDPEIAWCGLTETEARAQKRDVRSAKLSWRGVGRALTLGRDDGLTKLLVDSKTDRVLGVAMAGPGAGELIAEGVLAIEMAATAEDLRQTIHPHPTLSETISDAAAMLHVGPK